MSKSNKTLFLFTVMLFGITFSNCASALNEKSTCSSSEKQILSVDSTKTLPTNKWCLAATSYVYDCAVYKKSDGTCKQCPVGSKLITFTVNGKFQKACIPVSQIVVNCKQYDRKSENSYKCIDCKNSILFAVVPITGNANGYGLACLQYEIPGCLVYKEYSSDIGCQTCKNGFSSYAGQFYYEGSTSKGKACPKDESVSGCSKLILADGQYACSSTGCTVANTVPITYKEGSILVTCISKTSPLLIPDCLIYSRYDTDPANIECLQCKLPFEAAKNVLVAKDTYRSLCVSNLFFQYGCAEKVLVSSKGRTVFCKKCDADHIFVPIGKQSKITDMVNIFDPTLNLGSCMLPSRFNVDTSRCASYQALQPYTNTAICNKCAAGDRKPPCDNPKGTCTKGARQVTVSLGGKQSKLCVDSFLSALLVDNCAVYGAMNLFTGSLCTKCAEGYELVTTYSKFNFVLYKSCILKSYLKPNCLIYEFAELSCLQCRPGESCVRSFTPAVCGKWIVVGTADVCIYCPKGYTLKNNQCLKSVQYCSNLVADGVCQSCVKPQRFQLIDNIKCVERPKFCKNANLYGTCDFCIDGFQLDENRSCIPSTKNPCPEEQYEKEQGTCVPGEIKNCHLYTKNGDFCDQCQENFRLSDDFKKCISTDKWADFPPCEKNTDRIRYQRNYYGSCIAVDVNCEDYNEDGYCISCKDNQYAYQGLCYNVVFGDEKN